MADQVKVRLLNNSFIRFVECPPHVVEELSEKFTFQLEDSKYMARAMKKKNKKSTWDGSIRLFNRKNGTIGVGLFDEIEHHCKTYGYNLVLEGSEEYGVPGQKNDIDQEQLVDWLKKLPKPFLPHDYQYLALVRAIKNKRQTILCPTGSGKSFIIYMIMMCWQSFLGNYKSGKRTLIICPTQALVLQMKSDLDSYGFPNDLIQVIMGGHDKEFKSPVVVSTWQSIYKLPREHFESIGIIFGDECHGFSGDSLTTLMNKCVNADYRIGLTGTLNGTKIHELQVKSLFGPVHQMVKTKELQERGILAPLSITILELQYPKQINKHVDKLRKSGKGAESYKNEIDFVIADEKRRQFVVDFSLGLEGNTLVLFNYVENHGIPMSEMFAAKTDDFHFVYGGVDVDDREEIRNIVDKEKNTTVLASYGTFSTGINIKNIHNIVFASPTKSIIRVLQSIGRGLRISEHGAETTRLFDIADLLYYNNRYGYCMSHAIDRIKIYDSEEFSVKKEKVDLYA